MKVLTLRLDGWTRAGLVDGDEVVELPYDDVRALIATGEHWQDHARAAAVAGRRHPLAEVSLAPLVPYPEKIICLGRNYLQHVRELDRERPQYPVLFSKFHRSLVGAYDPIELPPGRCVDWEAELVLVIGRQVRRATREQAIAAVAGYTVMNDVSARDWQSRTPQWLQGKTFERSTPLGPVLLSADEVPDLSELEITCEVNGEVVQRESCANMIFQPAAIVEYISEIITLVPGDIIATGTPGGVGMSRTPPVFLAPGDVLRTRVNAIGECVNLCKG